MYCFSVIGSQSPSVCRVRPFTHQGHSLWQKLRVLCLAQGYFHMNLGLNHVLFCSTSPIYILLIFSGFWNSFIHYTVFKIIKVWDRCYWHRVLWWAKLSPLKSLLLLQTKLTLKSFSVKSVKAIMTLENPLSHSMAAHCSVCGYLDGLNAKGWISLWMN